MSEGVQPEGHRNEFIGGVHKPVAVVKEDIMIS